MGTELAILRSNVARNMLLRFYLAAIIPILLFLFGMLAYVASQTERHEREQLQMTIDKANSSIHRNLDLLSNTIKLIGNNLVIAKQFDNAIVRQALTSLTLYQQRGKQKITLFGKSIITPIFNKEQITHLNSGRPLISTHTALDKKNKLLLIYPFKKKSNANWQWLAAEINPNYLLGITPAHDNKNALATCLLADNTLLLSCPNNIIRALLIDNHTQLSISNNNYFVWQYKNKSQLAITSTVKFAVEN